MDMIDQIGGWRPVGGVGARYSQGYDLDQIRDLMGAVVWLQLGRLRQMSDW